LPSDVEGMPLSLLEAMSYGCNVLVSNIEENTQVIGNYGNSFKKSDIQDLTIKLKELINNNPNYSKEEISNYICNKYNWDEIVEKLVNIYKDIKQ
jgi:glycosyltransferase involved in cell wall biosynthesis